MPVYNGGATLPEAIRSLLQQRFEDLELVISDNASTDDTESICRDFADRDSRVRYIRQPHNRGPMWNFRHVLQQAKADYFMWAAHDDRWANDFVGGLVEILDQSEDLVLAGFEAQYILADGTPLPFFPEGAFWRSRKRMGEHADRRCESMLRKNYGNLIYGLFRRDGLIATDSARCVLDIYDDSASLNEIPVFMQIAKRGRIFVSAEMKWWKRTTFPTFVQAAMEFGHDFRDWSPGQTNATGQKNEARSRSVIGKVTDCGRALRRLIPFMRDSVRYHIDAYSAISQVIPRMVRRSATVRRLRCILARQLIVHVCKLGWWKVTGRLEIR